MDELYERGRTHGVSHSRCSHHTQIDIGTRRPRGTPTSVAGDLGFSIGINALRTGFRISSLLPRGLAFNSPSESTDADNSDSAFGDGGGQLLVVRDAFTPNQRSPPWTACGSAVHRRGGTHPNDLTGGVCEGGDALPPADICRAAWRRCCPDPGALCIGTIGMKHTRAHNGHVTALRAPRRNPAPAVDRSHMPSRAASSSR